MDLFAKEEKGKEILNDGNTVIIHLKSNGKFDIEITNDTIKVTPKGFSNAVNKGLVGTKTYAIQNLSGVQFKEPGFTTGYIQFVLMGSAESKRGVTGAVHDENSVMFSKKERDLVYELKDYIEYKISQKNAPQVTISTADEIMKFKGMLDSGIITQEEFDAAKKKFLN